MFQNTGGSYLWLLFEYSSLQTLQTQKGR